MRTSTEAPLLVNVNVSSSSTVESSLIPIVTFASLSWIINSPVNLLPTISDGVIPSPVNV